MISKIVWDSDGTIVKYMEHLSIHQYEFPGYFFGIPKHENIVKAINALLKTDIPQYICTKCPNKRAVEDKDKYFRRILPKFPKENIIYIEKDKKKELSIPGGVKNAVLVDDFGKNLTEWELAGGISVKCFNDINGTKLKNYKNSISVREEPEIIIKRLLSL